MRRTILLCLIAVLYLVLGFTVWGFSRPQPASDEMSGIIWGDSFEAAKARAQLEGKPILLLHLFGRLDEELC